MMIDWQSIIFFLAKSVIALLAGLILHRLVFFITSRVSGRLEWRVYDQLSQALRSPSRILFPLLILVFTLPAIGELGPAAQELMRHGISLGIIGTLTWLATTLVDTGANIIIAGYNITKADNLDERRILTQVKVLKRTFIVVIVITGIATALMTFPRVKEIGASLLVSAGVAGLAIGLAARPLLENLIAGLQLAFTQPIRVDDVVIIEGEWGRIEEITTTYVVVRIWDERRLIVPFSTFISRPFQNWTRQSADILGTVLIHADYTVPVQAVREELERLCKESELWDGRVCNLQVTEATADSVQLRALVSASDSGRAWDLRVHLREHLVRFLQREYPDCLPRTRVTLNDQGSAK
jgi:small-conductance mechanosensitive channel